MEIRGKALKSIQKYVRDKHGDDGFDKWTSAISVDAYTVYATDIDGNTWYPLKTLLIEPMANIAQLFFQWNIEEAAWELGRTSADYGLKGAKRLFVKLGSAKFFLQKASELITSYYRPCEAELPEYEEGRARIQITKFPDMEKSIELRIGGWIQRALEINGCKNVEVKVTRSIAKRDPLSEFLATWE